MRRRRGPVFLVLDGHPAHIAKAVAEYVQSLAGRLELHFLPGYASELNPDEFVWNHLKRQGVSKTPLHRDEALRSRVHTDLAHITSRPALVRSFFHAPSVAYTRDCLVMLGPHRVGERGEPPRARRPGRPGPAPGPRPSVSRPGCKEVPPHGLHVEAELHGTESSSVAAKALDITPPNRIESSENAVSLQETASATGRRAVPSRDEAADHPRQHRAASAIVLSSCAASPRPRGNGVRMNGDRRTPQCGWR